MAKAFWHDNTVYLNADSLKIRSILWIVLRIDIFALKKHARNKMVERNQSTLKLHFDNTSKQGFYRRGKLCLVVDVTGLSDDFCCGRVWMNDIC